MVGWLAEFFGLAPPGSARAGQRLKKLLAGYPPSTPPHLEPTAELSDAQCKADLDFLIETRDERLTVLAGLLADFGLDIAPVLDPAQDPGPTFKALDSWIRSEFPFPREQPPRQRFTESDRAGPDILFSLIADLALLEGEAIVRRRDDFAWALDDDPDNWEMSSYRRPCVVRPRIEDWASTVFDLQIITLETAFQIGEPGAEVYPFGDSAIEAIAGRHDPL
ncbi:MAG: hypothetical protein ACR2PO_11135 [Methyloligellaceae bacterium]